MLTKMPPIVLFTIEFNTPNTINNLRITVTTIARVRLDIGPASAVNIIPFLLSLKVLSSTDTGFPQPTPIRIIDRKPIGSICAKGLRVNLPFIFWLISPSLYATHACAYSCIDRDSKRAGNVYKNVINPSFLCSFPSRYSFFFLTLLQKVLPSFYNAKLRFVLLVSKLFRPPRGRLSKD